MNGDRLPEATQLAQWLSEGSHTVAIPYQLPIGSPVGLNEPVSYTREYPTQRLAVQRMRTDAEYIKELEALLDEANKLRAPVTIDGRVWSDYHRAKESIERRTYDLRGAHRKAEIK